MSKDNPFGDGGGSRIGRPDTPKRDNVKPDNAQGNDVKAHDTGDGHGGTTTGAGAEAVRGIVDANDNGSPTSPGSEPLEERKNEHESGYGGKAGEPRTSSDQR